MALKQQIEISAKDKTKAAASSVKRSLNGVSSAAASMGSQLGLAFGIGGMGYAIKQSLDAADKIQKLSIRLGASTESLSQLQHAANLSGSSFEALTNGMKKLQKSSQDAVAGLSTNVRGFEALGISVERFAALAPEDQLSEFADAISKIEEPSKRTQVAMDLMGRAGVELIPMLEGGSEGLNKMRGEADKLGLTLSRDQVNAAAAANDAITRMTAANKALSTQMAIELAPTIEGVAEFLGNNLPAAADFTSAAFNDTRRSMGLAVAGIATGLIELYDVLEELPGGIGAPYARAKKEMESFRASVFDTVDQISEKQGEVGKVKLGFAGEDGDEKKTVISQIFGTEEEMQDDMDRALDLIDKQFSQLDEAAARGIAGLNKIKADGNKKQKKEDQSFLNSAVNMAQAGNKSMTELARNAALDQAKIHGKEAIIAAYRFGNDVGGPIVGAAFAATASVAVGSLIGALKGGGEGSAAPAATVSSVPSTEAPIPVAESGTETTQRAEIVVSGGLHSDEDVRSLVERMEQVKQDMGGNVQFTTVVR